MSRKPVIVGNWKMNKTVEEALALTDDLCQAIDRFPEVDAGIAPTFCAVPAVAKRCQERGKSQLIVAAQNCHPEASGAFTGELSVAMLADVGCTHIIIGHSERRQLFAETDAFINEKVHAVLKGGLAPIFCIGETLEEREAGETFNVVSRQLKGGLDGVSGNAVSALIVAYEPVWAIGTGKTATPEQAQEVHAFLRQTVAAMYDESVASAVRIQYGGSVKPSNVADLMALPDVDGALVGGASLNADSFIQLLNYQSKEC